jgi:hypothetical protein
LDSPNNSQDRRSRRASGSGQAAPPFLSYDDDFAIECPIEVLKTLHIAPKDISLDSVEPVPATFANGQAHINLKYRGQFRAFGLQAVSTSGWPVGKFPPPKSSKYCSQDLKAPKSAQSSFQLPSLWVRSLKYSGILSVSENVMSQTVNRIRKTFLRSQSIHSRKIRTGFISFGFTVQLKLHKLMPVFKFSE